MPAPPVETAAGMFVRYMGAYLHSLSRSSFRRYGLQCETRHIPRYIIFSPLHLSIYDIVGSDLSGIFNICGPSGPLLATDFENVDGIPDKAKTMSLGNIQASSAILYWCSISHCFNQRTYTQLVKFQEDLLRNNDVLFQQEKVSLRLRYVT